ncbi:glycosyltransferase family 4 protein [Aneurinibacillus sp. UBA3580]|uniref:glycosyltransferase family 4 protein n=1 Tax=Aneurinibacillus sp. UBA3580 TaxID=1946041 RepID=UPI00257FF188|nr:glycosyltransferase family 4 protein [Aneurinibacillus sp. UBA3580]
MINILHMTPSIYEGGIEEVIENIVCGINVDKFKSVVACYNKGSKFEVLRDKKVKCYQINKHVSAPFEKIEQIRKVIEENNIDIVHSHYCFDAVLAGHLLKKKVVETVHSIYDRKKGYNFDLERFRYQLSIVDRVVCVSELVKKHIISDFGIHPDKVEVIKNWVNKPSMKSEELLISEQKIGTVSRIAPEKGLDDVLDIAAAFPAATFSICGNTVGNSNYANYLKQKALQSNLNNVYFTPFEYNAKNAIYRSLSIFLVTSRFEGSGLTAMEALLRGCCVISYDVGDIKNFVKDGVNGYIVKDIDEMKQKIRYLLENPEHLKAIRKNNANSFISNNAELYEKMYKCIVTGEEKNG